MRDNVPTPDAYWVSFEALNIDLSWNGRLLAGEYSSAKEAAEADTKLNRFLESGVTFFLDLTEAGEYKLRPYAKTVQQLAEVRQQTVSHHRFAIPDMGTPSPDHLQEILDCLDGALERGETVYVHCFGGIGRTGTVIGCWLVRHGLTGEQALAQIAAWRRDTPDGWRVSPETAAQKQMVLSWHQSNHPPPSPD